MYKQYVGYNVDVIQYRRFYRSILNFLYGGYIMKYDFDTVVDRRNTNSMKWDVAKNVLPMWVADMDFTTAPEIRQAIEKRAAHGIFGYAVVPKE